MPAIPALPAAITFEPPVFGGEAYVPTGDVSPLRRAVYTRLHVVERVIVEHHGAPWRVVFINIDNATGAIDVWLRRVTQAGHVDFKRDHSFLCTPLDQRLRDCLPGLVGLIEAALAKFDGREAEIVEAAAATTELVTGKRDPVAEVRARLHATAVAEDEVCDRCGVRRGHEADCPSDPYNMDDQQSVPCRYFALCDRPAVGTLPNPVLGDVPTCQRCADTVGSGDAIRPFAVAADEATCQFLTWVGSGRVVCGAVLVDGVCPVSPHHATSGDHQLAEAREAVERARVERGLPADGFNPDATEPVDEPDTADDRYLAPGENPWF